METRANYILIGAFAVLGFLGMLGFFLWFAQIELNRQFALYDIDFTSVSGLGDASDVRFAGLSVGRVVRIGLSPEAPGRVRVRVEVDGATPVRADSLATIEAQGVTGVSYVGISAGSPDAPLLAQVAEGDIPVIAAGQSALQSITEDAPQLLAETLELMRELREMVSGENQDRVENILVNVEQASVAFSDALDDFSQISGTVTEFAEEIGRFNETLDALTGDVSGVLEVATDAIASIDAAAIDGRALIGQGSGTLTRIDDTVAAAGEDLSSTADEIARLSERAGDTLARAERSFDEADQTMAAIRETIAPGRAALEAAEGAFEGAETMFAEDLPELRDMLSDTLASLEAAVAEVTEALPAVTSDIRAASRSAEAAFAGIEQAVGASAPPIRAFATGALPQYGRLADELRELVQTTEALMEQLRRDPARFFVEPRAPEYRR